MNTTLRDRFMAATTELRRECFLAPVELRCEQVYASDLRGAALVCTRSGGGAPTLSVVVRPRNEQEAHLKEFVVSLQEEGDHEPVIQGHYPDHGTAVAVAVELLKIR